MARLDNGVGVHCIFATSCQHPCTMMPLCPDTLTPLYPCDVTTS
jgi:hypothetical protein